MKSSEKLDLKVKAGMIAQGSCVNIGKIEFNLMKSQPPPSRIWNFRKQRVTNPACKMLPLKLKMLQTRHNPVFRPKKGPFTESEYPLKL